VAAGADDPPTDAADDGLAGDAVDGVVTGLDTSAATWSTAAVAGTRSAPAEESTPVPPRRATVVSVTDAPRAASRP
jgi:hypothetical protein